MSFLSIGIQILHPHPPMLSSNACFVIIQQLSRNGILFYRSVAYSQKAWDIQQVSGNQDIRPPEGNTPLLQGVQHFPCKAITVKKRRVTIIKRRLTGTKSARVE